MHVSVGQQWGKATILQLVAPCSSLPTTFNAVIPHVSPSTYRDRSALGSCRHSAATAQARSVS
ncbi:hypothetical protein D0866_06487 [Hortaea werneckii]|uniref:Uncharacterized protein n=1 Tax=Hortaea werneckii TaxID=91943 RepID=A0A3M7AYK6_HORWE|nr:hypothetical protein D0866_06487 [Hortaea werneckii]